MITLNDIPPGYVKINPGEDMPEECYYMWQNKAKNINNIKSWNKLQVWQKGEKRINNDDVVWFIKPVPAPKVKPVFKQITDIKVGDVFAFKITGESVIINQYQPANIGLEKYIILGVNNTLSPFSFTPLSKENMISYLNINEYIYITNIAPQIEKTLKLARQIALEGQ